MTGGPAAGAGADRTGAAVDGRLGARPQGLLA
jgi:hypothetical protein